LEQGGELVAQFPRAIAIGIALPHSIIDLLPQRTSVTVARRYEQLYVETNQRLDQITARVISKLQQDGFAALAVRASLTVDPGRLYGVFANKMAAHLAGLGWIGKSCLLITPEAGPRVRWASVLTHAPLAATGQAIDEQCGACEQCVEACPPRAFTGKPFRVGEHRDVRFAAWKCRGYLAERKAKMGCRVLCGLCVSVCPHGRRDDPQNYRMESDH
jgi:epoxyqueuosine reductase QueG